MTHPVDRSGRDAGLLGELPGPAAGRRRADHREPSSLVDLPQRAGGVGFARAGERLDGLDAVAAGDDRREHPGLILGQRPVQVDQLSMEIVLGDDGQAFISPADAAAMSRSSQRTRSRVVMSPA